MRIWGRVPAWEPTRWMVHYEGHGPRRVYLARKSGRHFVKIGGRRVWLTQETLEEIIAKSRGQGGATDPAEGDPGQATREGEQEARDGRADDEDSRPSGADPQSH